MPGACSRNYLHLNRRWPPSNRHIIKKRPFAHAMRRFWRKCYMNATVEGPRSQPLRVLWSTGHTLNHSELQHGRGQSSHTSRIAFERRIFWRAMRSGFIRIVEDVMGRERSCRGCVLLRTKATFICEALETDCVAGHIGLELPNPREFIPLK